MSVSDFINAAIEGRRFVVVRSVPQLDLKFLIGNGVHQPQKKKGMRSHICDSVGNTLTIVSHTSLIVIR